MSTHIRTISIGFMVLMLLCVPCMAACPYADSGNVAEESTSPYTGSSCGGSSCSSGSCSGNPGSCSGDSGSCSGNSDNAPDAYGAFRCDNGSCESRVYEDGNYDQNTYENTGTADSQGAVVCKDGDCKSKVCKDGNCETGTFSTAGNSLKSWFDSLFGGSGTQAPVETSEEAPVSTTYSVPKTTASSTNFYGNFASSGTTSEDTTPVAVEDETQVPGVTTPVSEEVPACSSTSTCGKGTSGQTCSTCSTPETVKPACETVTPTGGVAAYDTVYNALKADKTEKNVLSETYTSLNFAQDVCASMSNQGIDCTICKVTFTDGKVNYFNKIQTDQGELKVDSCGTSTGTGIKKVINTLEVGQQWKATSLFKQCTLTYTRGTVASVECLE